MTIYPSDTRYAKVPPVDLQLAIAVARNRVVSAGTTTASTVDDADILSHTGADYVTEADLQLSYSGDVPRVENLTPDVATIDANGAITRVADGTASFLVGTRSVVRRVDVSIALVTPGTTTSFVDFVAGSLADHLVTGVTAALSGKTTPVFSNTPASDFNASVNIYSQDGSRNSQIWCGSTDLTAIPQHSGGGYTNGVLISKRDMIFANHFGASGTIFFNDNAGGVVSRNIVATSRVGSTDILVATLDSDVPSSITPVKILPSDFRDYLPQPQYGYPAVFTNQDRTLLLGSLISYTGIAGELNVTKPVNAARSQWFYTVRGGDSGSPVFLLINGELILVTNWHYAGAWGPIHADNLDGINSAMENNGSPYSVATADLTDFTSYSG